MLLYYKDVINEKGGHSYARIFLNIVVKNSFLVLVCVLFEKNNNKQKKNM